MSKTKEFFTKLEDLLTEYAGTNWEYNFESEQDGVLFNHLWVGRKEVVSSNGRTTTRAGKFRVMPFDAEALTESVLEDISNDYLDDE
jgi:hypothetical protein